MMVSSTDTDNADCKVSEYRIHNYSVKKELPVTAYK